MTLQDTIYRLADELRAIASMGRHYAKDPYDEVRYERVLGISAELLAELEDRDPEEVLKAYSGNLSHFSPLAGADAVVVRDGKVLLIRRHDSGLWALPGGLVEVGDTLAGAAERELWEETGLRGKAVRYLGYFDSRSVGTLSRMHLFHHAFLMEAEGEPQTTSEATEVGFFAPDALPEMHRQHGIVVPRLMAKIAQGDPGPIFE